MKNLFYLEHIHMIGGIETFFYNLALKYGATHDIAVVYRSCDDTQIDRLSRLVECIKFEGQIIKCDRAFFNLNIDIIDYIEAKEYIQIIHGDYAAMHIMPARHPKITRWVGVSNVVCEGFKELTGNDIELCYNPTREFKKTKSNLIRLVSLTRLDPTKGLNRMMTFMEMLEDAGLNWHWTIFADDKPTSYNPRIEWRNRTLDIEGALVDADYLVQLSDAEGYGYSVVEALQMGIPVIVTDLPVFREIGVVEGVNGFFVNKDLTNIPFDKIAKKLKKFTYTPPEDRWGELLVKGKGKYQDELKKIQSIRVKQLYYDMILEREVRPGEVLAVTGERALKLTRMGLCEYINKSDGEDDAV